MVPPPQLPGGVPPPPHPMYHVPPQQPQQRSHPRGGYPPPAAYPPGLPRYAPMHSVPPQQQHTRVHPHAHPNHLPNNYRAPLRGGHPPFPVAPMGLLPSHPHPMHPYPPPRNYRMPPSSSSSSQPHHPYPSSHGNYANAPPRSSTPASLSGSEVSGKSGRDTEIATDFSSSSSVNHPSMEEQEGTVPPLFLETKHGPEDLAKSERVAAFDADPGKTPNDGGAADPDEATVISGPPKECIDPFQNKAAATNDLNVSSTKKAVSMDVRGKRASVMSPITMCFERMLGAAEAIKTPGSANFLKKRGPFSKKILPLNTSSLNIRSKRLSEDGTLNPFNELLEDPDLERLVILQMAMQRNQHFQTMGVPGAEEKCDPLQALPQHPKREIPRVITEGFFWREYPACEQILYNHMHKYYEISAIQKNYKVQQYFNNVLVDEVRKAAEDSGFTVDPDFCDKKLRDRIRCFYKTHLQNAKKRLATLQKHADSFDNQCLVAVFIRCVRNPDLTFEDSLAMGNTSTDQENAGSTVPVKKRKIETLKTSTYVENSCHTNNALETPVEVRSHGLLLDTDETPNHEGDTVVL